MRVNISALNEATHGQTRVEFTSAVGNATAVWEGAPPVLGLTYDVELDVPGTLAWGAELRPTDAVEDAITMAGDHVLVRGALLSLDDDGTVAFGVGGSVMLLETEGQPYSGARLEARVTELHLHDTRT